MNSIGCNITVLRIDKANQLVNDEVLTTTKA